MEWSLARTEIHNEQRQDLNFCPASAGQMLNHFLFRRSSQKTKAEDRWHALLTELHHVTMSSRLRVQRFRGATWPTSAAQPVIGTLTVQQQQIANMWANAICAAFQPDMQNSDIKDQTAPPSPEKFITLTKTKCFTHLKCLPLALRFALVNTFSC